MIVQSEIESRLKTELSPTYLDVDNESHQHSVPENSETHFRVVIASEQFDGRRSVARHQLVYKVLADQLEGPVHALALHTYTPAEWAAREVAPPSPACLGGSKQDDQ
ncbi:MAG: BolA protein [Halioglobus sp.]|jgi:BolA protein